MCGLFVIFSCLVAASCGLHQGTKDECPPNEILDNCANALCRHQECTQRGKPLGCPGVSQCVPGCVCAVDYMRNFDGICVPENQCEPQPCPNSRELYTKNKSACARDTCAALSEEWQCAEDAGAAPAPGCMCAHELYVRKEPGAPCDYYICDCPQMANSTLCQPVSDHSD